MKPRLSGVHDLQTPSRCTTSASACHPRSSRRPKAHNQGGGASTFSGGAPSSNDESSKGVRMTASRPPSLSRTPARGPARRGAARGARRRAAAGPPAAPAGPPTRMRSGWAWPGGSAARTRALSPPAARTPPTSRTRCLANRTRANQKVQEGKRERGGAHLRRCTRRAAPCPTPPGLACAAGPGCHRASAPGASRSACSAALWVGGRVNGTDGAHKKHNPLR